MGVLAELVILGTLMGILAMALLAWVGGTLLQRLFGRGALGDDTDEPSAGPLLLVSSGQGKHRPSRGGPSIAA
jgi:hypothetical protein